MNNRKMQDYTEREYYFYPDNSEKCWQYVIFVAIILSLVNLSYITLYTKSAKTFLFLLLIILLTYVVYICYFMWKAPKLYIDKEPSYIHLKSSHQDDIILLKDIKYYDYFYCYTNPLKYPFLNLCVQLFLNDGKTVEFFAFMKGSQTIIEEKMQTLGIHRKKLL